MNEIIAKLTEQCYEYNETMQGTWFNKTKFAELIGQECLALADSIRDECDKDGENQQALGAAWVGIAIARHFGVEE